MTGTDLSKLFDCSIAYISQLVKIGMPKEKDGSYDINKVVPWYVNNLKDAKKTSESQSRARKLEAEARIKEIELRELEENLIQVDDAIEELGPILMAVKSQLSAIPPKVAPQIVGLTAPEAESLLTKFVDQALHELSVIPERMYSINDVQQITESIPTEVK